MTCYYPITAYKLHGRKTKKGKGVIVFKEQYINGASYEVIQLPCSRCIGCRIDKTRDWAIRCVNEASLYEYNCFVTLTYSDDYIDNKGSLVKADLQKFMKRLRERFVGLKGLEKNNGQICGCQDDKRIRFFACGEYGERFRRPHYHVLLFNFDFLDKYKWSNRNGKTLYRSNELERLWTYGYSAIGDVNFDTCAYCARYIFKKVNGKDAYLHYIQNVDVETGEVKYFQKEFTTMSRRPGIGRAWYEKFKKDLYKNDFQTEGGQKYKPCSYYDKIYDLDNHKDMESIKKQRLDAFRKKGDNNMSRLHVRAECKKAMYSKKERKYENDF